MKMKSNLAVLCSFQQLNQDDRSMRAVQSDQGLDINLFPFRLNLLDALF